MANKGRIFYISDTHFGDKKMHKWDIWDMENNPQIYTHGIVFSSCPERDEAIIENWRRKVTSRDHVYILGDVFNCCEKNARMILKKLPGIKHLVIGNHDKKWLRDIAESGKYSFIGGASEYLEISDAGRKVVLCHYPMPFWNKQHEGSYHVYGHLHGTREERELQHFSESLLKKNGGTLSEWRAMNAGCMLNAFEPCTLDELVEQHGLNPLLGKDDFKRDNAPWNETEKDVEIPVELGKGEKEMGKIEINDSTKATCEEKAPENTAVEEPVTAEESNSESADSNSNRTNAETNDSDSSSQCFEPSDSQKKFSEVVGKIGDAVGSGLESHGITVDTEQLGNAVRSDVANIGSALKAGATAFVGAFSAGKEKIDEAIEKGKSEAEALKYDSSQHETSDCDAKNADMSEGTSVGTEK